jgi:hypothetical protein
LEAIMLNRLLLLLCGIFIGMFLRGVLVGEPSAVTGAQAALSGLAQSHAQADSRCATHPVKMPCLFDPAGK